MNCIFSMVRGMTSGSGELVLGRVLSGGGQAEYVMGARDLLRHALVAGPTGCGKSMFLSSLILQVLCKRPDVRVVLVDPKGETHDFLLQVALPALSSRYPHLRGDRILTIDPFGPYVVGLDPLVATPDIEPAQHAWSLTTLLMSLFDGIGDRMRSLAGSVLAAVITLRGTLMDAVRCLTEPAYARTLGAAQTDPRLREYMMNTLHGGGEPVSSVHSLRARLEYLLQTSAVRTLLTCGKSVTGGELLSGPFTSISTGRPPMGDVRLSRFFAQLLFLQLTTGIFERTEADARAPVLIVVDEFPEVVRADGGETVERILSLARSRGCFIWAACQSLSQVSEVSPALVRSLLTNVGYDIRFRPDPSDVRHLDGLLPVTGRRVDPERPDRTLSEPEERRALLQLLTRLPPRQFLLADRHRGTATLARTLTVPVPALRALAAQDGDSVRAFLIGRTGVRRDELMSRPALAECTRAPTRRFEPDEELPSTPRAGEVAQAPTAAAPGRVNVVRIPRRSRGTRSPGGPILELP